MPARRWPSRKNYGAAQEQQFLEIQKGGYSAAGKAVPNPEPTLQSQRLLSQRLLLSFTQEVIVPKQKGIEAPQEFVELVEPKSVELVEVVVPPNALPGAVLQVSVPPGTNLDKGVFAPASPLSKLITPSSELIDR